MPVKALPLKPLPLKPSLLKPIAQGVVHKVPDDLRRLLSADSNALEQWQSLTPLGRNEWICWVEDAKKAATREHRMQRLQNEVREGKRRPCCWPGCSHREKNGKGESLR